MKGDEAKDALEDIRRTTESTRDAVYAHGGRLLCLLWGSIWVVGFLLTYLFEVSSWGNWVGVSWLVLNSIGGIASWRIAVSKRFPTTGPMDKRIGISWFLFFCYLNVPLVILWPWNGYQLGAYICATVGFVYILMGILFAGKRLALLGALVIVLTVGGFYLLLNNPLYWIWMSVFGGGSLVAAGLIYRRPVAAT